jgi:hypothetical protein
MGPGNLKSQDMHATPDIHTRATTLSVTALTAVSVELSRRLITQSTPRSASSAISRSSLAATRSCSVIANFANEQRGSHSCEPQGYLTLAARVSCDEFLNGDANRGKVSAPSNLAGDVFVDVVSQRSALLKTITRRTGSIHGPAISSRMTDSKFVRSRPTSWKARPSRSKSSTTR